MATQPKTGTTKFNKTQQALDLALSLNKARNIDEILIHLVQRVAEVCQAEGATIYAIDPDTKELYSRVKVQDNIKDIRLPISPSSVAGYAAETGQVVRLRDAYDLNDLAQYPGMKFDDSWDRMSGFRTRSVLCVPLRYKDTGLQGVIQLINSHQGNTFPPQAEKLITSVARAVAVAFYNQNRINREPTKFDLLVDRELISPEDLQRALAKAEKHSEHPIKGDPISVLMYEYKVTKIMMVKSLEHFYKAPVFEFREGTERIYDLIDELDLPVKYLSLNLWVPIRLDGDTLTIAMDDPKDVNKISEIISVVHRRGFEGQCRFVVAFREDIKKFLDPEWVPDYEEQVHHVDNKRDADAGIEYDENAPTIVKMVNDLIRQAFDNNISDIHIEPYPVRTPTTVRFRLDGICHKHSEIRKEYSKGVINRFKIMANLKLDEKRMPQSGKIKLKYHDQDVELRVEVTPTYGGLEDVVIRLLASSKPLELEYLNFLDWNLAQVKETIAKPYGIFLAVGPTGSGKTTTLHSILSRLNTPDKKIWTVEDPVEITQRGLRQVQVNPHIKPRPLDFAMAMRSFLRADPDIIMVGEMRDRETAAIALEASLTGHLVLSTLHTNSAPETVPRIVEMGLDPINVSDAVLGILAQRLVRTLCDKCKQAYVPTTEELQDLADEYGPEWASELDLDRPDLQLYEAVGCPKCNDAGYLGRTGIHELLVGSPDVKRLIREKAPMVNLRNQGMAEGMRTLKMDGIRKIILGQTDLGQVLRVCID